MEQRPKYYPKPPIPAVELSLRPLEVEMSNSPSPKAPNPPPPPIDLDDDDRDTAGGDENDLHVMEDEGGNGGPRVTRSSGRRPRLRRNATAEPSPAA